MGHAMTFLFYIKCCQFTANIWKIIFGIKEKHSMTSTRTRDLVYALYVHCFAILYVFLNVDKLSLPSPITWLDCHCLEMIKINFESNIHMFFNVMGI